VIALGHLAARLAAPALGAWAWLAVTLVQWGCFALLVARFAGRASVSRWLGTPGGGARSAALAFAVGLIPLPILLTSAALLDSPGLVLLWLVFAAINPFLEEGFWRGLVLERTSAWPEWLSIGVSSALFAANHPLSYGVVSLANAHPATLVSTFVMGVGWSVVFRRSGSLRWPIAAHAVTDLCNLSVLAFMNLYVPRGA
jgi:membrane protease YdiL (CAAX protease family)